jgi:hypothetical protein
MAAEEGRKLEQFGRSPRSLVVVKGGNVDE